MMRSLSTHQLQPKSQQLTPCLSRLPKLSEMTLLFFGKPTLLQAVLMKPLKRIEASCGLVSMPLGSLSRTALSLSTLPRTPLVEIHDESKTPR